MCNRYRTTANQATIARRYGVEPIYPEDATCPPPELFPKKTAFVVREELGRRGLDLMGWGFPRKVPGKKTDKTTGKPVMIHTDVTNVRNYTSPFWRTAMARRLQRIRPDPWGSRRAAAALARRAQPADRQLRRRWRPLEGGGAVFAFLTCDPNPIVAPIHPKAMTVLLAEEDEKKWLSCSFEDAIGLAQPFPSQLMRVE